MLVQSYIKATIMITEEELEIKPFHTVSNKSIIHVYSITDHQWRQTIRSDQRTAFTI